VLRLLPNCHVVFEADGTCVSGLQREGRKTHSVPLDSIGGTGIDCGDGIWYA
jgi:hypothetical protein